MGAATRRFVGGRAPQVEVPHCSEREQRSGGVGAGGKARLPGMVDTPCRGHCLDMANDKDGHTITCKDQSVHSSSNPHAVLGQRVVKGGRGGADEGS